MGINEELTKPFPISDIEWRVQSSGMKGDKAWAMVLAYVTARAVQNRLDTVFGVLGWKDTYRHETGGVICSLSVWDKEACQWVTKENGSPETQIEAFKGGISKAFVRVAASGLGVGRYLYNLDTNFVNHTPNGKHYDVIRDKQGKRIGEIKWNEPNMPQWAMSGGEGDKQPVPEKQAKFENAEYYNGLAGEISHCTNQTKLDKWCKDNSAKIAKLNETDKERLRGLVRQYKSIFESDGDN